MLGAGAGDAADQLDSTEEGADVPIPVSAAGPPPPASVFIEVLTLTAAALGGPAMSVLCFYATMVVTEQLKRQQQPQQQQPTVNSSDSSEAGAAAAAEPPLELDSVLSFLEALAKAGHAVPDSLWQQVDAMALAAGSAARLGGGEDGGEAEAAAIAPVAASPAAAAAWQLPQTVLQRLLHVSFKLGHAMSAALSQVRVTLPHARRGVGARGAVPGWVACGTRVARTAHP